MDIRLIKIEASGLTGRALNAMRREGVETVGDLMKYTEDSLHNIRNLGDKSISDILQVIEHFSEMESAEDDFDKAGNESSFIMPDNFAEWKTSADGREFIADWLKNKEIKISALELLSTRSYNLLMLNGYTHIYQFFSMTTEELMQIPRMDRMSAEEIVRIRESLLEEKSEEILADYKEKEAGKTEQRDNGIRGMLHNRRYHDKIFQYVRNNDIVFDMTECSNRLKNQLQKNGLFKLSDLIFITPYELLELPKVGRKTVDELTVFIDQYLSEHKDKLTAFCMSETNDVAENADININVLLRSAQYRDRFLEYVKAHDVGIENLNCSIRTREHLAGYGFSRLSDFIFLTRSDIKRLPHLRGKSADEIINCIDAYLAYHENRIIAFCQGDDTILWDDLSLKIKILEVFNSAGFKGFSLHEIREAVGIPDRIADEQLKRVFGKMIADRLLEYVDFRCYRIYQSFSSYLKDCTVIKERSKDILFLRLRGETLENIGALYDLTKERVRQISSKDINTVKHSYHVESGMEFFDEDYYRYFYETYYFDKKDAEKWLGISRSVFNYLEMSGSKRGKENLEEALNDSKKLDYGFRLKIKNYLNRNKLYLDGKWIDKNRSALEDYAVRKYCSDNVAYKDFCVIFNDFLSKEGIEYDEDIYYTEAVARTRKNRLTDSRFLLWKQNEQMRYYDIDGQDYTELLDTINLEAYENIEYSTLKFIREYPEIMEKYDIRDQYELHNLLKKVVGDGKYHNIHFERTPMIRFGTFDRDSALLDLLIDNAPISIAEFADLVSEEYGYDPATVMGSYLQPLSIYYHNGVYAIDYKVMPYKNKEKLQENLKESFYYIDEIRRIYTSLFPEADLDDINPFNLKNMGFLIRSRYVVQNYNSLEAYFRDILICEDIIDITPYRNKFAYVQAFSKVLTDLKKDLVIMEFEPNQIINYRKLASAGIIKEDLKAFCDQVYDFVEKNTYFSVQSIKKEGFVSDLFELGFSDWFYSSLLASDNRFSFSNMFLNIVLYKGEEQITIKSFEEMLIQKHGSIDVYDLMTEMEEVYGCKIHDRRDLVYKVKETKVVYDSYLDRLYADTNVYDKELDEAEGI